MKVASATGFCLMSSHLWNLYQVDSDKTKQSQIQSFNVLLNIGMAKMLPTVVE